MKLQQYRDIIFKNDGAAIGDKACVKLQRDESKF